ncbi:MAG TPA: DUF5647 family protein, partial [Thermomicrobiaceae bacterium]|nr:DUF5647 family protein [Thermomicrobiaceae bacterium]
KRTDEPMTDQLRDLVRRNLALHQSFITTLVETGDTVPKGAVLILLPSDDRELAAYNFRMGVEMVMAGRNVYFRQYPREDLDTRRRTAAVPDLDLADLKAAVDGLVSRFHAPSESREPTDLP